MERIGSKKIIRYGLLPLLIIIICSVGMVCIAYHKESVKRIQLQTLVSAHPELEGEIAAILKNPSENKEKGIDIFENKYGYTFSESIFSVEFVVFWCLMVVCITIVFIAVYMMEYRREKNRRLQTEKILYFMLEILSSFKKGDYQISSEPLAGLELDTVPDIWKQLVENLRDLGSYFADLKENFIEEENSTKSLITDISHQLKTPLASLRMSHELVMAGNLTEEEQKEFLQQEKREIEKIELLLNELVKISRLEHHMIEMAPKQQDIKETVAEAVSQVYGKAKGKQIEIQVDILEHPIVLHDRKWTAEAISNVLDNAVKYSKEHTTIFLRVKELTQNLLIEIEDSGMGIEKNELHQIFKRFYRGSKASKYVTEGVGVGLCLTRMILEQQGGTIMAKGKHEGGTVFLITLPL